MQSNLDACVTEILQVLVVVGSPLVARIGYYCVIRASFVVKIICGLTFLVVGHQNSWIVATFLLVERYVR
jgi:hypothetical protein